MTPSPRWTPLLLVGLASTALLTACDDDPLAPSFDASRAGSTIAAPTNLTATAYSYEMITLAWQDNATNEAGFEVWRSTDGPTGTFSLFTTYPFPNSTQGVNSGLQAATQYCYEVRAYNTLGQSGKIRAYSAFSNVACATTLPLPVPAAPSNVKAAPWVGVLIRLTWTDNASDENGFRVERSATSSGPWTSLLTWNYPNLTSFDDRSPPAGEQPACYRVIAFNSYGDSPASNVACTAVPNAPTNLVATGSGSNVDLTWTDNSEIEAGYVVYRWTAANGTPAVVMTLPANTTAYQDPGLADDTYLYQVRATKDGGESNGSNNASASVLTGPPAAAAGVDAYPASSNSMTIAWRDNSATEAGFRIERSSDGGLSWTAVGTVAANWTSFSEGSLPSEQPACYRVMAFNGLGDAPASNTDCATPPAAPTGLVATGAEAGAIDLAWMDNSGVEEGYAVERLTVETYCDWYWDEYSGWYYYCYDYSYYQQIATLGSNATSYHDTGLNSGDSHTYRVVALKDGGVSDYSNEATAIAP